jgi:ribosomal protein S18 acetylase RimI-like enzyme
MHHFKSIFSWPGQVMEALSLELRVACEDDAKEIAALVNSAYRPSSQEAGWTHEANIIAGERVSSEQVLSLFCEQSTILLLCLEQESVACVHVQGEQSGAYIGMLATKPAMQAQGLGKRMLLHAAMLRCSRCLFYLYGQNSWLSTSGVAMFLPGRQSHIPCRLVSGSQ